VNLSYVHGVETRLEYALTHSGVSVLITAQGVPLVQKFRMREITVAELTTVRANNVEPT